MSLSDCTIKVSNRTQTVCQCQTVQWKYQTQYKQYVTVRLYNESIKQNTNSMSLSDGTMEVSNRTQTVCHCQTVQ